MCVLCIVGATVAISTGVATRRANRAIDDQTARWDAIKSKDYSGPDIEGVRSRGGFWFLMPGYLLPWIFFVAWVAIAFLHRFGAIC